MTTIFRSGRPLSPSVPKLTPGLLLAGLLFALASTAQAITFTVLSTFSGTNGAQPMAGVLLSTNGNFYGTTLRGGVNSLGSVFTSTPDGAFTNLFSFGGTNGAQPASALIQGIDGNFYGTTSAGGDASNGTVFVVTPTGNFTNLASFGGTNGGKPFGPLAQGPDGSLYGTTSAGGDFGLGTAFVLPPGGPLTTLVSFDGTNGGKPFGGLVARGTNGGNGGFLGTASSGGGYNSGTIFSLRISTNLVNTNILIGTNLVATNSLITNLVFTNLYTFTGGPDGAGPQSGLVADGSGNFYGTTAGGGTNNIGKGGFGTVFKITPNGNFTSLLSFAGTNGSVPFAPVFQGSDGSFYGTTTSGGASGQGTVFMVSTNGTAVALHSFGGSGDGANPAYGGVVQWTNGAFYGTASAGGGSGDGTFFAVSGFPPFFVTQPANQTAPAGSTVTFTVVAAGSTPFRYQWRKNTNNLTDGGRISGSTNSTLTIANASTNDSGTYFVVVRNSAGSITNSGAVLSVINPFGTNAPLLNITSPTRNSVLLKELITVSGTTSSSVPVAQVYFRLNGGVWQLGTANGGWAKWSGKVTLAPGINVVDAYAINIVGTVSKTNSVSFTCGKPGFVPIVVQINGNGTVSPNYNLVWLKDGGTFNMTANPKASNWFSSWSKTVGSNAPVSTTTPKVTFTAETNLVLAANFIPNPFIPVMGTYSGLFAETNGVTLTSAGFFTFNLNSRGTFSGNLQTPAARFSMSGKFDTNGVSQTMAKHSSTLLNVAFQLDMTNHTDQVSGSVNNGTWTADLDGDRAIFDGRTLLSPQMGQYTMLIPGTNTAASGPGGDSYATMTVDKTGRMHFACALADNTKASQGVPVSKNGQWPLYAKLYSGNGMLLGWITLSNAPADVTGDAAWLKAAQPKAKVYPGGFTNSQSVIGSHYYPPGTGTNILSITNGLVAFTGGGLTDGFTNEITFGPNNQVTQTTGSKQTFNFTKSNGSFRGKATESATAKPMTFGGVSLQNQNIARGYFLRTNLTGGTLITNRP